MKTPTKRSVPPIQLAMTRPTLVESLPRWEEIPQRYQQELILALAALLMQQPELQVLLEVRCEPKP